MKIGVGISTFNRPDFLDVTLWHWNKYSNDLIEIVVIDDGSDKRNENKDVCEKYSKVKYVFQENKGISGTKTKSLSEIKHCDYVFLSDDDCFPIKENYWEPFIDAFLRSGNHHFMYLYDSVNGHQIHGPKEEVFPGIESYSNCGGMLLFATNKCINEVGGFDNRMRFYGYEHAQWTLKIHSKNFNPHGKYLCPTSSLGSFFTIDFDRGWRGLYPEYWNPNLVMQSSISTTEDKKNSFQDSINYNASIFGNLDFYTPI